VKLYRLYVFDLDGTLYRGSEAVPEAVSTVAELRKRGAMIRFLTNNSGQTRAFYMEKLERLGFEPKSDEIYSSAIGAAKVCAEKGLGRLFFVGEPGLRETLLESGAEVANSNEVENGQAQAVVAGICHSFTYRWLNSALQQIVNGAQFIATNTDATYPIENGRVEPGAGSIVASIQTASGVAPLVIGKPDPMMLRMILADTGVAAKDALAVGDRYETDIVSGQNAGVDTHLVLTGVTRAAPSGQSFSYDLSALLG